MARRRSQLDLYPQLDLFGVAQPAAAAREEEPAPQPPEAAPCNWWDFCPNCGTRLHNARCKYVCPRCHYFMSCSDFD